MKQIISDAVAKSVVLSHSALMQQMLLEKKTMAKKTKDIRVTMAKVEACSAYFKGTTESS